MTRMMTVLCVFFCALFCLGGCSQGRGQSLTTDFAADFTAAYRGMTLEGKLTYTRQESLNLTVRSPGTLDGVTVGYRGGELTLGRDSLRCTADEAYLPCRSFPSLMKDALTAVCDAYENDRLNLKEHTAEVTLPQGKCEIKTDDNAYITEITVQSEELRVRLTGNSAL